MGCHTWFYKKSNDLTTVVEIKEYISIKCRENIKLLQGNYSDYSDADIKIMREDDAKQTAEDNINRLNDIKYFSNILKNLKYLNKRRKIDKIFNLVADNKYTMIDNFIYEDAGYHDLFRYGDYEAENLKSSQETFDFIKSKHIYIDAVNYNKVLDFWNLFPNGIIEFG